MIDPFKLKTVYIEPVLEKIQMYSPAATMLLLGTCAAESDMGKHTKQIGGGPALGIFQMEPGTYYDICTNVIPVYWHKIHECIIPKSPTFLQYDLQLAIIMARLQYARFPERLPDAKDIFGQAKLYKLRYNSHLGKGTEEKYREKFDQYLGKLL